MSDYRVPVLMNHGRWVAACPRPGCGNAEGFGRCDDGTVGGLLGTSFTCRPTHGGCGFRCGVAWPDNVEDLEMLLLARPARGTRNWFPGEDASELLRENIEHGLIPTHEMDVIGGKVILHRALPAGRGE